MLVLDVSRQNNTDQGKGMNSSVTSRYIGVGAQNGNFFVTVFLNIPLDVVILPILIAPM